MNALYYIVVLAVLMLAGFPLAILEHFYII